jgi:acyl-CoA thioesterase FadM
MTGKLTVRYRNPTPLHTDLRIEGRRTSVEGRRITAKGTIHAGDTLTAEAEGLFISIRQERAEELFGTG